MAKVNITAICMDEVVPSTDGLIVPSEGPEDNPSQVWSRTECSLKDKRNPCHVVGLEPGLQSRTLKPLGRQ